MNKRTRIMVVAAALLAGMVATGVTGAGGSGQVALAGAPADAIAIGQRARGGVEYIFTGRPTANWQEVGDVVRALKRRVPPVEQRGEVVDVVCKVKDLVVPENAPTSVPPLLPAPIATPPAWTGQSGGLPQRPVSALDPQLQSELMARLERLKGWPENGGGYLASVESLTENLREAKDHGDEAMIGADLFCMAAGAHYRS